jgi:IS1 family transposase
MNMKWLFLEGIRCGVLLEEKDNDQFLWLVMHAATCQILAFHVGRRNKASGVNLDSKIAR